MVFTIYLLIIACCCISSFVQRVSGFGLATLLMPLLLLFLPFSNALIITGVICAIGSGILVIQQRKHIQWKYLIIPMIPYVILSVVITNLMHASNIEGMKRWLGLFLFILGIYLAVSSRKKKTSTDNKDLKQAETQKSKGNTVIGVIVGAITGIINPLFNIAGPPMAMYFLRVCKDNLAYLATLQVFLTLITVYTNVVRAVNGMFSLDVLPAILLGLIGLAVGFIVGSKVFDHLNSERLKYVVYAVVAASGFWLFISDILGIA